jgi:hypothetical protein
MRRPTVQGAPRRTHSNKSRHHEAATDPFGQSTEHPCGLQQRTIARTTRKSCEYLAAYVVARIVLVPPSGQASGEVQLKGYAAS